MIELINVRFNYDESETAKGEDALKGLSLKIRQGEFVGIAGHNGSGKSTLAKLMNGLLLPTEGDVLVLAHNTKDEEHIVDIRRNVGMIFQNPDNQMVAATVEEDVAFGAENLGIEPSEIRRLIDDSLKIVDMNDFIDRPPNSLSGGQKQRIAIAGVLAMKPKCIIFDESTAMLDPSGRAEVLKVMKQLNREEKVTIVFITHYMEELTGCDRIVVLDRGTIAMDGTPKEIFADDRIEGYSLRLPEIAELAQLLRNGGLNVEPGVLTIDELVDEICRLA